MSSHINQPNIENPSLIYPEACLLAAFIAWQSIITSSQEGHLVAAVCGGYRSPPVLLLYSRGPRSCTEYVPDLEPHTPPSTATAWRMSSPALAGTLRCPLLQPKCKCTWSQTLACVHTNILMSARPVLLCWCICVCVNRYLCTCVYMCVEARDQPWCPS